MTKCWYYEFGQQTAEVKCNPAGDTVLLLDGMVMDKQKSQRELTLQCRSSRGTLKAVITNCNMRYEGEDTRCNLFLGKREINWCAIGVC